MKVDLFREILHSQHLIVRLETYMSDPGVRLRVIWRWSTRYDIERPWKKNGGSFSFPVPACFWPS